MDDVPSYWQLPGLQHLYLEDSWVLALSHDEHSLVFDLDFVLTEEHPLYTPPKPKEQYCYRKGQLRFSGAASVTVIPSTYELAVNATGEVDYGNIDSLLIQDGIAYLEGDWGEAQVTGGDISVTI